MDTYVQELEKKLAAARGRVAKGNQIKALKASAPALFEIIDGEISLGLNKLTAEKALSYDDYLEIHGQIVGIRRIRDLLNSKEVEAPAASQEAEAIQTQLKQFDDDKKQ